MVELSEVVKNRCYLERADIFVDFSYWSSIISGCKYKIKFGYISAKEIVLRVHVSTGIFGNAKNVLLFWNTFPLIVHILTLQIVDFTPEAVTSKLITWKCSFTLNILFKNGRGKRSEQRYLDANTDSTNGTKEWFQFVF